jgi:hypothetical protein
VTVNQTYLRAFATMSDYMSAQRPRQ